MPTSSLVRREEWLRRRSGGGDQSAPASGISTPAAEQHSAVKFVTASVEGAESSTTASTPRLASTSKSKISVPGTADLSKAKRPPETIVEVTAPPGMLGLHVNFDGESYAVGAKIGKVTASCPPSLRKQVAVGDRIITINGENVKTLADLAKGARSHRILGIIKASKPKPAIQPKSSQRKSQRKSQRTKPISKSIAAAPSLPSDDDGPTRSDRITFSIAPGVPGIKFVDMNGLCRVLGYHERWEGPFLFKEGDFVVSLNGRKLAGMRGGLKAWGRVFQDESVESINVVVMRMVAQCREIHQESTHTPMPSVRSRKFRAFWDGCSPERKLEIAILNGYDDIAVFEGEKLTLQDAQAEEDAKLIERRARSARRSRKRVKRKRGNLPKTPSPLVVHIDSRDAYKGELDVVDWERYDRDEKYGEGGKLDYGGMYFAAFPLIRLENEIQARGLVKMGISKKCVGARVTDAHEGPVMGCAMVKSVRRMGHLRDDGNLYELERMLNFFGYLKKMHSHGENFKYRDLRELDVFVEYALIYDKTGELVIEVNDGEFISFGEDDDSCWRYHDLYETWLPIYKIINARRSQAAVDEKESFMAQPIAKKLDHLKKKKKRKGGFQPHRGWLGDWFVENRRRLAEDDFPVDFPKDDIKAMKDSGLFKTHSELSSERSGDAWNYHIDNMEAFHGMPGKCYGAFPRAYGGHNDDTQPSFVLETASYLEEKLRFFQGDSCFNVLHKPLSDDQREVLVKRFGLVDFDDSNRSSRPVTLKPTCLKGMKYNLHEGEFWIRCSECQMLDYVYEKGTGFTEEESASKNWICYRCPWGEMESDA